MGTRMSARQLRNARKAQRRRDKVYAAFNNLIPPLAYDLRFDTFDYGWFLRLTIEPRGGQVHAHRRGAVVHRRDRRWRHMDDVPQRMLDALLVGRV
jgi:hypothetical protein